METTTNQSKPEGSAYSRPLTLPNSTAVLVLGILSIVGCWCLGIVGLALGIIALVLSKNAGKLYAEEPEKYTEASFKNMNAGKICAIVGVSLSGLYIAAVIIKVAVFGAALGALFSTLPWHQIHY